jgi:ABC-type lipoprotein export system ATPase subunit
VSSVLVAERLEHRLGGRAVLTDVSVAAEPGEVVAIVGPSGSGKTTLLSILGGLDAPHAGRVVLAGFDLYRASLAERARRRAAHVGFVFQSHNLLPALTAEENVALAARQRPNVGVGMAAGEGAGVAARAKEALARLGLGALGARLPRMLSLGEQQRVAVARALVTRPAVLIADEPTASLDGESGQLVLDALALAAREGGAAVLMATHDERCRRRASRVVELLDGRVLP